MYNDIFSVESNIGLVDSTNNTANRAEPGYSKCLNNVERILSVYPGTTCGYEKHRMASYVNSFRGDVHQIVNDQEHKIH